MKETGILAGLRMRVFGSFCNRGSGCGRAELGRAVGGTVEHEAVGVVAQPIEGRRGKQPIGGEGLVPLGEKTGEKKPGQIYFP